jgi:hypothetical protein
MKKIIFILLISLVIVSSQVKPQLRTITTAPPRNQGTPTGAPKVAPRVAPKVAPKVATPVNGIYR